MVPSPNGFKIDTVHYQTKLMANYADTYTAVILGDGTHNLSREDLIVLIYTTVDCLGKTVVTGVTHNFSESCDAIVSGLRLFYKLLSKPEPETIPGSLGMFMDPLVDPILNISDVSDEFASNMTDSVMVKATSFTKIVTWLIKMSEQERADALLDMFAKPSSKTFVK